MTVTSFIRDERLHVNLATIIDRHDGSRIALIDGTNRVDYQELRGRVAFLRQRLLDTGIGPDSQVAIVAANEIHFVVAILAVLGAGGIAVPILPSSPLPEVKRKLASFDPSLLLLGDAGSWLQAHVDDLPPMLEVAAVEPCSEPDELADPTLIPAVAPRQDDDLAFLLLTSGVSGDAKVAMLSHGNLGWVQQQLSEDPTLGLAPEDVSLGVLPFSHIFGLNVILLTSLRLGASVILQRRFDAEAGLALIRQHSVTAVAGAPPMWRRWAEIDAPDDAMATVHHAASGAAALPLEVFNDVRDRYGIEIAEGYGLTETSPVLTWSQGLRIKPGSVGKAMDGVEIVLADQDGTPVEVGDIGEIVVRSPGVFKGYLNAPAATEAVLTVDGWFWTGDIGAFDDAGYLHIVDRIKDVINVSGFNVYPSEVENVLMEHAAVRGAVVIGTPDDATGEGVTAYVSGVVAEAELAEFARDRLSSYKCPSFYYFVDDLPVAPTGKLIRRELR